MGKKAAEILLLCGVVLLLLFFRKKENKIRKLEKKREQMLLDYPDIVSKMLLFLGAGMTIRNALEKIAGDYQEGQKRQEGKRFAYEEIVFTCHEMESGVMETDAYERMGQRIRIPRYRTFALLLSQHLRKGSRELVDLLEREALEAFEERKRKAHIAGEEAATKLLFPMLLMLLVVLVVLMVPAFMSFGI